MAENIHGMPFQGDAKTILSTRIGVFDLFDGFFRNINKHEDGGTSECNYMKLLSCEFLLASFD